MKPKIRLFDSIYKIKYSKYVNQLIELVNKTQLHIIGIFTILI